MTEARLSLTLLQLNKFPTIFKPLANERGASFIPIFSTRQSLDSTILGFVAYCKRFLGGAMPKKIFDWANDDWYIEVHQTDHEQYALVACVPTVDGYVTELDSYVTGTFYGSLDELEDELADVVLGNE